jgi:hypothetical protein
VTSAANTRKTILSAGPEVATVNDELRGVTMAKPFKGTIEAALMLKRE